MATADVPREAQRTEWLTRLSELVDSVQRWAEELGWATRRIDKRMEDPDLGVYPAPGLRLQRDFTQVLLEPIARSAPGAEGVVDLYLVPAYDDIASLYYHDGGWHLRSMVRGAPPIATTRKAASRPLSRERLRDVLEAMTENAVRAAIDLPKEESVSPNPNRTATDPFPTRSGDCPTMTKATIRIPGLKVAVPLAADALPRDLVPMDGPAGEPTIDLVLDGGSSTAGP